MLSKRHLTDMEKYNKAVSNINRLGKACLSFEIDENDLKRYSTLKERGALKLGEICMKYGFTEMDLELLRAMKG